MTLRFADLVRDRADRIRLALFGLCAAAALLIGFVLIKPATIEPLIKQGGYYYMLAMFAAFVIYAWRVIVARVPVWREWWRRPGWTPWVILGGTAFAVWSDSFAHKVLFDEYVLQGT